MTTLTTPTSAHAWRPDVTGHMPEDVVPDALVLQLSSVGARIEGDAVALRVPLVKDDAAHVVPEGSPIPEAAPELAEAMVYTRKIAKLLRISREQFLQPGADRNISRAAARSIIAKADELFLTGEADPTTGQAGILNQSIPEIGALDTGLDTLVDAVAATQAAGGNPSHILVSPDLWATIRKVKTGDGSATSLLGVGAADARPLLLGLPVVVNRAMPAGTGLVLDSTDIVSAVSNVESAISEHAYFGADSIAMRALFRFGATVVHPDRHATFTAPTATA